MYAKQYEKNSDVAFVTFLDGKKKLVTGNIIFLKQLNYWHVTKNAVKVSIIGILFTVFTPNTEINYLKNVKQQWLKDITILENAQVNRNRISAVKSLFLCRLSYIPVISSLS